VAPESVGKLTSFLQSLSSAPGEFITPAADWLRIALATTRFANIPIFEAPSSLASAVAQCAQWDLQGGAAGDPAALDANYVRRSDAELFWKDI
jgi:tRNA threonylcarbamoyladenosine biosynthesis protein TsaB